MPDLGEIWYRPAQGRNPVESHDVWDGFSWISCPTRMAAERAAELIRGGINLNDPSTNPEISQEALNDIRSTLGIEFQNDPDIGFFRRNEEARLLISGLEQPVELSHPQPETQYLQPLPEHPRDAAIGSVYWNIVEECMYVRTTEGWMRTGASIPQPPPEMNLGTAQGVELDNLARIMGVQRIHNWPDGIGRAIEPDVNLRQRIIEQIRPGLPLGVEEMDVELSPDGRYVNVTAQVRTRAPVQQVTIEVPLNEPEREDVIDEESRWKQIADEM